MDNQTFEHLCTLARMRLGEEERTGFENKFQNLLSFVEQILGYEPASDGDPLTLTDRLEPRLDKKSTYEWPEETVHRYATDQVIDFDGDV